MDLQKEIKYLLSKDVNVYDELILTIEAYFSRHVTSMKELKERELKKNKGDVWESFCEMWVRHRFEQVWLWKNIPQEGKDHLKLTRREDNGIDIIVKTSTGYSCVQCKYRKKGKVTWNSITTFIAMAAMTGPFEKHIIMTNASGVTRKLARGKKDKSFCCGTFRKTPRHVWLNMVGLTEEHVTRDDTTVKKKNPSVEELRKLRISKFEEKIIA